MNTSRLIQSIAISVALAVTSSFAIAYSVQANRIEVQSCGVRQGQGAAYSYSVHNDSNRPIQSFIIGSTNLNGEVIFELSVAPTGYDSENPDLPPHAFTAPVGWSAKMYRREEEKNFGIEFLAQDEGHMIQPGQTMIGFVINVPAKDTKYLDGNVALGIYDPIGTDEPTLFFGETYTRMKVNNAVSPTISASATPNMLTPPNTRWVPVVVTINVSDDCDPYPSVLLEGVTDSILGDSGIGVTIAGATVGSDDRVFALRASLAVSPIRQRMYTFSYSATDITGRKNWTTTTVTVPVP